MVQYIGKPNNHRLKKYLLIGGATLAIATAVYTGVRSDNENTPHLNQPVIESVESIDARIDSLLVELENNPDAMNQNYDRLAATVEQGLADHPDYANRFIISGLESLDMNKGEIEKNTYLAMFQKVRDKAEEKPELMDHFGKNAQRYMEKKFMDEYVGKIENAFKDTASAIKEKSQPVIETLSKAKNYLMDKTKGE